MQTHNAIPPDCRELIHALNRRCREQWDRAERVQDELNDIKGSRAWTVFRWLRDLRRLWRRRADLPRVRDDPAPSESLDGVRVPAAGKVSIIIPFKDHLGLLRNCLRSLRRGTYRNLEIILVDNGSTAPRMLRYLERLRNRRGFRVVASPGEFNFAGICNRGANHARGDYLLFFNNDMEVQTPDWLQAMLELAGHPRIGIVGATLIYPDGTLQHAGMEPRPDGQWQHVGIGRSPDESADLLRQPRCVAAVTGACLLVRRHLFEELGGFSERYSLNFNDIDLCERARQRGLLVAVTPHARLVHFESLSRGYARP